MERIVYKKTLDVHKNGVQFMLQGFETADRMSRRIELSLMASGDTIDFPLEQITAVMYVTTPNATEPSINACVIKDNTIIYDVLPITEEGITEMQVKLIGTKVGGANGILPTPRFAVEVSKSNVDDGGAIQTPTYTALEDAIATARGVYDSRLIGVELDSDCTFRAIYADGTTYESDVLKELFLKGDVLLSQSYAKGGTGIRAGEDTDNSMYYSNVSRSASEDAKIVKEESAEILTEVQKHGVYTAFYIDFETGEVKYISPQYTFNIDKETGELKVTGETLNYEDTVIYNYVTQWFKENNLDFSSISDLLLHYDADKEKIENDISQLDVKVTNNTNEISRVNDRCKSLTYDVSALSDKVDSHNTTLGETKDYVVEQGEFNGWIYRKWGSGLAEAWISQQVETTIDQITNVNGLYRGATPSTQVEYPITFVSRPKEIATYHSAPNDLPNDGGEYASFMYVYKCNSNEQTGSYNMMRPHSPVVVPVLCYYDIYVVGKWK